MEQLSLAIFVAFRIATVFFALLGEGSMFGSTFSGFHPRRAACGIAGAKPTEEVGDDSWKLSLRRGAVRNRQGAFAHPLPLRQLPQADWRGVRNFCPCRRRQIPLCRR